MAQYACTLCGYIYDEKDGYPEMGVAQNTPWSKVPPDFVCPICHAKKGQFEEI